MENVEQEAIRRVVAGDRDAFRVLMDRHLPAVLRLTFRITGNSIDAEEAAQEAFLCAYNKLPQFREHAAFGTWVYRIAMNCSLNLVRRRNRDLSWNAVPLAPDQSLDNLAASRSPTPEADLLNNEVLLRREQAMRTLTAMERTAFVLRHMEQQPIDVIAGALNISMNSAKQAIFRAVSKLRRELAPLTSKPSTQVQRAHLVKEPR